MSIKRGDIYWIEQSKYRPAVGSVQNPGRPGIVVSNDANNACSPTLEVVYLTGKPKKDLPTHCTIRSAKITSIALCEQVTTVSVEQLEDYVGHCTEEEMAEVDRCIAISLGLPDPNEAADIRFFTDHEVEELEEAVAEMEKKLTVANARAELLQELYYNLLNRTIA